MLMNFHFLVHKSVHTKLIENGQVVTEKSKFKYSYVNDLGPRSRNDIDRENSHIFTDLVDCIYQLACYRLQ